MKRAALKLFALLAVASSVAAGPFLGQSETKTAEPVYQGVRAQAPIDARWHIINEGGSDGQGLCVFASMVITGQELGVPCCRGGKASDLWRYAKARPGGCGPDKWDAYLAEIAPDEPYVSFVGTAQDLHVLNDILKLGNPIGITMSWGDDYRGRIHHMVAGEHCASGLGCIMDNNNRTDTKHTWMSEEEIKARALDGHVFWVLMWARPRAVAANDLPLWVAGGSLVLGAAVVLVVALYPSRRTPAFA
jgi:hypothetical protein